MKEREKKSYGPRPMSFTRPGALLSNDSTLFIRPVPNILRVRRFQGAKNLTTKLLTVYDQDVGTKKVASPGFAAMERQE